MAVLEMKKIHVFGLNSKRKNILEFIQKKGLVEITNCEERDFATVKDTSTDVARLERQAAQVKQAIEILGEYSTEKRPFYADVDNISYNEFIDISKNHESIYSDVNDVIGISKEISELNGYIMKCNTTVLSLEGWKSLDVPLNFKGTKTTVSYIGTVPEPLTNDVLTEKLNLDTESPIHAEIIFSRREQSGIFVLVSKEYSENTERSLKEIGFSRLSNDISNGLAVSQINNLNNEIKKSEERIIEIKAKLKKFASNKKDIEILYDFIMSRVEKYSKLSKLNFSKSVFELAGFIPAKDFNNFQSELMNNYEAYCEEVPLNEDEEYPITLKNSSFSAPVEPILEDFSMPSKDDIDPSNVISFFYYFFFGMMFSDAGYGLLMIFICGFLGFIKKGVKPSVKSSMKMFFYCGISTIFWGALYGSWFGNIVSILSDGSINLKPILFDPIEKPLELLIICISFGMIHILTGLIISFYNNWRHGKKFDAIFDAGFWIILLVGISVLVIGGVLKQTVVSKTGNYMIIIGAIGLVLTQGRSQKNIFAKLFMGILSLYNITGYMSDMLSYSRLMALGLATGVIATVVNIMGSLAGGSVIGIITFVLILIIGHAINFGINMLGAYVHTNRLQYVEFLSKFYEGGGRKFKPFSLNSNYIKIKEEN